MGQYNTSKTLTYGKALLAGAVLAAGSYFAGTKNPSDQTILESELARKETPYADIEGQLAARGLNMLTGLESKLGDVQKGLESSNYPTNSKSDRYDLSRAIDSMEDVGDYLDSIRSVLYKLDPEVSGAVLDSGDLYNPDLKDKLTVLNLYYGSDPRGRELLELEYHIMNGQIGKEHYRPADLFKLKQKRKDLLESIINDSEEIN